MARHHLEKAQDSALQAVEIYNKPAVRFRSGGYIVLMVIAWTSLFHAILYRNKQRPFRKGKNGRFIKIDGDYKHFELDECLAQYYKTDTQNPVRTNLGFFVQLRNKIEHRSMPYLDANIFGECQQMLLNFDDMIRTEFSEECCLRESLSFALQLFPSSDNFTESIKKSPADKHVVDFINKYRSSISADVLASEKYSFKAFLIRVANHPSANALPVQFIHYDQLSDEQKQGLERFVAMIKYKNVPVANMGLMKPNVVVKQVQQALGNPKVMRGGKEKDKFNMGVHTFCWKKHNVRPANNNQNPDATDTKYCVYNEPHQDYLYTDQWVKFLISEMSENDKYEALFKPPADSP